jgi:hypothetical protein
MLPAVRGRSVGVGRSNGGRRTIAAVTNRLGLDGRATAGRGGGSAGLAGCGVGDTELGAVLERTGLLVDQLNAVMGDIRFEGRGGSPRVSTGVGDVFCACV